MAAVDIHQESEVELGGKRRCANGFGGWGLKGLLQPTSVVASASAFDAWLVAAAGQVLESSFRHLHSVILLYIGKCMQKDFVSEYRPNAIVTVVLSWK